jgi:very-short-patch-repair endonuclease
MRTNILGLSNASIPRETESKAPPTVAMARALRREMSRQERTLWRALRGNALDGFHFRRQHIIGGYIVDFYCHRARLAIEVDGSLHDRTPADMELRDRSFAREGISVLHIPAKAVDLSPDSVLWLIRQHAQNGVNAYATSQIVEKC